MTHRLTTNYAKYYCNWTLIVKVIVENVVTCFFGTQCSSISPGDVPLNLLEGAYRLIETAENGKRTLDTYLNMVEYVCILSSLRIYICSYIMFIGGLIYMQVTALGTSGLLPVPSHVCTRTL